MHNRLMLAKRITITIYSNELETLKKIARDNGLPLPLSRYLVLKSLNRLVE